MASNVQVRLLFLLIATPFVCSQFVTQIREGGGDGLSALFDDDNLNWLLGDDDNVVTIKLYSNFDNENDRRFFRTTLPWLVDNIGNRLRINYRFGDSGRNTGPRMCALRTMQRNTYLQSDFLRCEAQNTPINTCVTQTGVNSRTFNRCTRDRVNNYVRNSLNDFDNLIADGTPIILVNGRRELNTNDPMRMLRLICQRYGRTKPAGCIRPSALPTE